MMKGGLCRKNHEQRAISDHFDGKRFYYPEGKDRRNFLTFFKWMTQRRAIPWPKERNVAFANPHPRLPVDEFCVTFVNHSTVLIQVEGRNILTDPIWSDRCGPWNVVGPKRVHAPGIPFDLLPPIDLILLSHNHYDHFDIPTLKLLQQKFHPQVITGLGNLPLLRKIGMENVVELDWWQKIVWDGIPMVFVPARHFSARGVFDRDRTLWGGFVLMSRSGMIYFAGDTGYGPHFQQIRERFGSPRFSLIPIGAYKPRWFMKQAHLSPCDALEAHIELGSQTSMGIHFGTFHLSDEGIDEPEETLREEMLKKNIPEDSFWALQPGQKRSVPFLERS